MLSYIAGATLAGIKSFAAAYRGCFHMDEGYYYFRELEGRVLFGGGRNLDFAGEITTSFDLQPAIHAELEKRLRHIILPGFSFNIAGRWAGIMAFGQNKQPVIRRHSPKIALGVRMGGYGRSCWYSHWGTTGWHFNKRMTSIKTTTEIIFKRKFYV